MLSGANKARKRGRFRPIRRRVDVQIPSRACFDGLEDVGEVCEGTATYTYTTTGVSEEQLPIMMGKANVLGSLKQMVPLLWRGDYSELFKLEQLALEEEAGLMTAAHALKAQPKQSTYEKRYKKKPEKEEIENDRARSMGAAAMRQANQQLHAFSICAHSIAALAKRMPRKLWSREQRERRLLDRSTACILLNMMMETMPAEAFMKCNPVQHFVFDQKYCKKGESRGKHTAAERVDASGDLVELVSLVLVNCMHLPVPFTLCRLTPVEVIELRKTGPFTRDPALVKLLLDPATVKLSLKEFYDEFMGFIKQGMRRSGIRDPRALSVAKIARALAGRPAVAGGTTTAYRVLPPRLNCDTKSHADGVTLNDWFKQECGAADPVSEQIAATFAQLPPQVQAALSDQIASKMGVVAIIARGDGQSTQTMSNEKLLHPIPFKATIPAGGGFHQTGHFSYAGVPHMAAHLDTSGSPRSPPGDARARAAGNEGFHDCKYGRSKTKLDKDKVPKHIPNFENSSYTHCTTFITEDLIGTLAYFLLDVENPSPELLLDDHEAYAGQIKSMGGMAAFESTRLVGIPLRQMILAARAARGKKYKQCEAYQFHVARALAHKPIEARIVLQSLIAQAAAHPKIAEVVTETAFFDWLGNGQNVNADRAVEMLNHLQNERMGKFAAFESALEYTPHLKGFLHVLHAIDTLENGEPSSSDPLRESMINAADVVRADLKERLGTDLTIDDPTNRLYHTGGAPNARTGALVSHRPWEHLWRVADGVSVGVGRAGRAEKWDVFVDRFLERHLWTQDYM